MNGYIHTFEMNDVHYNAYNCDKFFKRLTKHQVVNNRSRLYYNGKEVFAYFLLDSLSLKYKYSRT